MHAWLGKYIEDPTCLTCGECIERCPRSVLHFEKTGLFTEAKE
jgi:NAD-dependent dihydropyrimidine dehydrogenase PreA subunit